MPASRREFLAATAALALKTTRARADTPKRFEGIFPIVQTPFTDSGAFDTATLANEVEFLHKIGVQGMTWPVNASEYSQLTFEERLSGAETIVRAAAKRLPVVIGVQDASIENAVKLAKHAEKIGADAVIAIPVNAGKADDARQTEYYSAIAAATAKPVFVQAIGDISVDLVIHLAKKCPTIRYVKDEAGNTSARLAEYRKKEQILSGVFTGKHGPTFLDDLARGAVGNMPASGIADLYVATQQAWKAGKKEAAEDVFSKTLVMISHAQNYGVAGQKYMLQSRGVFKNTVCRRDASAQVFDADARKAIDLSMAYVKPWLRSAG